MLVDWNQLSPGKKIPLFYVIVIVMSLFIMAVLYFVENDTPYLRDTILIVLTSIAGGIIYDLFKLVNSTGESDSSEPAKAAGVVTPDRCSHNRSRVVGWRLLAFLGLLFLTAILLIIFRPFGNVIFITLFPIGISFLAFGLSLKTDALVSSLADLNFDEKIAAMIGYVNMLLHPPNDEYFKNCLIRLRYDISALSHIQDRASYSQKQALKEKIIMRIKSTIQAKENDPDTDIRENIKEIKEFITKIYNEDLWK
jgi:hypothetical protein